MAENTEANLLTKRAALEDRLIEVLTDPDAMRVTYTIGERKFDWNGYIRELRLAIKAIDEQILSRSGEQVTVYDDPLL